MKDRIAQLLDHYKISSAQFAESIGVQRSSISHILSGRNNPSYDFLIKTLQFFTEISAEWLLLGSGQMMKKQTNQISNQPNQSTTPNTDLFSQLNTKKEDPSSPDKSDAIKGLPILNEGKSKTTEPDKTVLFTNVNNVESIILVYENKTFEIIQRK